MIYLSCHCIWQYAFEIKSSHTFSPEFFKGLNKWSSLSGSTPADNFVIYNGEERYSTSNGEVIPWEAFGDEVVNE